MGIPVQGHCDARFAEIREIFEKSFDGDEEIGAAICFVVDGETVVDLWGGHVDPERTRPWERDTIVNTYSTTKGMTAICAHQLIERGMIDLDAPVAKYWPEFAAAGKAELPVRWLLSHQAGLPAVRKPLPDDAVVNWDVMVAALAEQEPWWEPGTKHGYHALTFGFLVGEVIRRASGKTVGEWFREHVSGPLDADYHIGFGPELDARTSDLQGSLLPSSGGGGDDVPDIPGPLGQMMKDMRDPSTMTGAAFNNPARGADRVNTREWRAAEVPAANGHGTARALARIYGALARGGEIDGVRLLEPESIELARSEQAFGPDAVLGQLPMRFGLGFMLRQDLMPLSPSPNAFGHPGAGGSIGMADPDAKVGFGYTMNKMHLGLVGGPSAFAVLRRFFELI
ncbi:MAG: beta-lactamase family protein [Deltaproteobacteria bacterium]|nr:beta-lactamase family protein [Deltaproteobacteria bacterium]